MRQWLSRDENPFLKRALRSELRRHQPLLAVGITLGLIVLMNFLAWRFWLFILNNDANLQRGGYSPVHLPEAIGGNIVGFFALITACVCALMAFICVRIRAGALLRQELLGSTLDGLQLMPIREERWLWMMSAHPLLLSLLIGAAGLPIYALAVWTDNWSWADVFGLALVFVWIGHAAPMWQPVAWKQGKARTPQKLDWATLRAQMSANAEQFPAVASEDWENEELAAHQNEANRLELQRRNQRLMAERPTQSSTRKPNETASESPAFQNAQAAHSASVINASALNASPAKDKTAQQAAQSRGVSVGFGLLFFVFRFLWIIPKMAPRGGVLSIIAALMRDVFAALPLAATAILPAFLFTWPLLIARVLLAPLPFFSRSLAPLWFAILLWIGWSTLRNAQLASLVSASETFWTLRRTRRRTRLSRFLWLATGVAFLGYAWPTFIARGELGTLLGGAPVSVDWALAALWTVLVVGATLGAGRALETSLARAGTHATRTAEENAARQSRIWKQTAFRVLDALAKPLCAYFGFCFLGATLGWSVAWQARLAPTLLTALAFVVADFGAAALQNALPISMRSAWKNLRFLWFFGLPLEVLARYLWGAFHGTTFSFEQAPHVLLSPFVTLFALLRGDLSPAGGIAWWPGLVAQSILGLVCFGVAYSLVFGPAPRVAIVETQSEDSSINRVLDWILWPFHRVGNAFANCGRWMKSVSQALAQRMERFNEAMVARGVQADNAVLTGELRRRVRKANWCRQWLFMSVVALTIFLAFGVFPIMLDLWTYGSWARISLSFSPKDFGAVTTIVTLILSCLVATIATLGGGQSFDSDRANGALVFLFLTPMNDRAIVWGKAVVELVYASLFLSVAVPWLLLGALLSLLGGDWLMLPIALCGIAGVLSTVLFSTFLNILFACARQETWRRFGQSAAILSGDRSRFLGARHFHRQHVEFDRLFVIRCFFRAGCCVDRSCRAGAAVLAFRFGFAGKATLRRHLGRRQNGVVTRHRVLDLFQVLV